MNASPQTVIQPGPPPPGHSIDVATARHASEPSRYLLAVLTGSLVLAVVLLVTILLVGRLEILRQVVIIVLSLAFFWFVLQIRRVRLLERSIKVTHRSTPELQAAVDAVRQRLAYTKRVDVYVTDGITTPLSGQSVLGTRILLLKGDFVAELIHDRKDAELIFLLATYFGALKARFDRLNAVRLILSFVNRLVLFDPLLKPWTRATVYTGDQLAYLCCNDLDVSLSAAFRSLVGKEMAPLIRPTGVLDQARSVRRSVILRLVELFSDAPHPTNRYLNLLAFAARQQDHQYGAYLAGVDPDVAQYLEAYRARRRSVGGTEQLYPLADVIGAGLVALAFIGGMVKGGVIEAEPAASSPDVPAAVEPSPTPTTPSPVDPTTDPPAFEATDYENVIDAIAAQRPGLATTCSDTTESTVSQLGMSWPLPIAVAHCTPTSPGTPDAVDLYLYESSFDASEAFTDVMDEVGAWNAGDWGTADCASQAPASYRWTYEGDGGQLGCFTSSDGVVRLAWNDDGSTVMSIATGEYVDDFDTISTWWGEFPILGL